MGRNALNPEATKVSDEECQEAYWVSVDYESSSAKFARAADGCFDSILDDLKLEIVIRESKAWKPRK